MIRLSREVRTALVPPGQASQEARNSWAGWPASDRLVPRFRLQLEVEGTPDPKTGYLCNIQVIDRLLRDVWNDYQAERDVGQPAGMLLAELGAEVVRRWPQAVSDPQAHAAQPAHAAPPADPAARTTPPSVPKHAASPDPATEIEGGES